MNILPQTDNLIYNPAWADLLENALSYLWDGTYPRKDLFDPDDECEYPDNEYICCCLRNRDKEIIESLTDEIERRIYPHATFKQWYAKRLNKPIWMLSSVEVQASRKAWVKEMIKEFGSRPING